MRKYAGKICMCVRTTQNIYYLTKKMRTKIKKLLTDKTG